MKKPALRLGIGGPVGSGKTALVKTLCAELRERFDIAVITNDIYTREDAEFLLRHEVLDQSRILGVGLPGLAMASAQHETQYSRLFRS